MTTSIDPAAMYDYLDADGESMLREYFGSGRYTGGRFERFDGGGDRPEVANRFTPSDIVAVSMLSVRIPGRAALGILEGQAHHLNDLLEQVPNAVDLWDAGESVIAGGAPADQLWQMLKAIPGIGWVTAGKLLARKRPRLLPVYDVVVKSAFGLGGGWWRPLRQVLSDEPGLVTRLEELRSAARIGQDISLLRVLDVAVWMKDRGQPEATPNSDDEAP